MTRYRVKKPIDPAAARVACVMLGHDPSGLAGRPESFQGGYCDRCGEWVWRDNENKPWEILRVAPD